MGIVVYQPSFQVVIIIQLLVKLRHLVINVYANVVLLRPNSIM